ncbi:MAG: hypothetical protein QXX32_00915 [Thermofilum sp.]|uniref:hypothetical protein n=1 Tax=Thermofilum sp. TaxID=1961369 RepID=UPI003165CCF8
MQSHRRGQFALLGIIVLAVTILAILAQRPAEPAFAFERGSMQSAQLIHLARFCLAIGCSNATLASLVSSLQAYNSTEPLLMFPVVQAYYRCSASTNRVENYTFFTIQTLKGYEIVALGVSAQSGSVLNVFAKSYRGFTYVLKNTTLTYCHVYASPFSPIPVSAPPCPLSQPIAGLVYCPKILDPSGVAEIKQIGPCTWAVAIPGNYTLRDEFGIPVKVIVRG